MYYDMQMDIVMESSNEAFLNINFKSIKIDYDEYKDIKGADIQPTVFAMERKSGDIIHITPDNASLNLLYHISGKNATQACSYPFSLVLTYR